MENLECEKNEKHFYRNSTQLINVFNSILFFLNVFRLFISPKISSRSISTTKITCIFDICNNHRQINIVLFQVVSSLTDLMRYIYVSDYYHRDFQINCFHNNNIQNLRKWGGKRKFKWNIETQKKIAKA